MLNASTVLAAAKAGDTDKIIALCRQVLLEQAAKEKGGNELVRRTKAAHKMMAKVETSRMPMSIYGAVIRELPDGSTCQCFTNGFYALMLFDPIEGLPAGDKERALDIVKFIHEAEIRPNMRETPINTAAIKAHIKEHGAAVSGRRKPPVMYNIGKCYYAAQYILDVVTILGGKVRFYQDESNPMKSALLISDNGKAILMPMRPPEKESGNKKGIYPMNENG